MNGDSARFTRQDSVEETWRILQRCSRCSTTRRRARVRERQLGAGRAGADKLVAGYGGWQGPWT